MLKKDMKTWLWIFGIAIAILLIFLISSVINAHRYENKAKEYDNLEDNLLLCLGNLSIKEKQYNDLERVKNTAISALTQNQTSLKDELVQLKADLETCQASLQESTDLIKEKDKTIAQLQSDLSKCSNYTAALKELEDKLSQCQISLTESRKLQDKRAINFLGLTLTIFEIKIVQIISGLFILLLLTFPLSVNLGVSNGVAVSWVLTSIIVAVIAFLLEKFKIDLPLMPEILWLLIIFGVLFTLFAYLFRNL